MGSSMIDIFTELGRRMSLPGASFGATGVAAADIRRAAGNIASDMLAREALAEWLARYPDLPVNVSRNVLIIMAGNIPFVGLHDLLCTLAAGHRAIVKPSSKDSATMSWVVAQLLDTDPGLPVSVCDGNALLPRPDAVIAMGGNDAVAAIGEKYAGLPMLLRGNRSSLAVLDGTESPCELAALADDILAYSGLGCRNVSLVFVPGGYDPSQLQGALSQRSDSVDLKHRNNYRQARAMLKMTGAPHIDCPGCLLVGNRDFSENISVIHYAYYDDLSEVKDWIKEHDAEIQCVACSPRLAAGAVHPVSASLPPHPARLHSRSVALGETQRPGLADYPDGRDTMQFLAAI